LPTENPRANLASYEDELKTSPKLMPAILIYVWQLWASYLKGESGSRFWSRTTALGRAHRQHPHLASGHALRIDLKMKRSKCWIRREG